MGEETGMVEVSQLHHKSVSPSSGLLIQVPFASHSLCLSSHPQKASCDIM